MAKNRNRHTQKGKITEKETLIWIIANAILILPIMAIIMGTISANFDNDQIGATPFYFYTQYYLIALLILIFGVANGLIYKIFKIKDVKL